MKKFPDVVFRLGRRRVSSSSRAWLIHKRDYFSRMWKRDGARLLRRIEKVCGISFPRRVVEEGMVVYLYKRRKEDGDYLGDMVETSPRRINIYLAKDCSWRSVKGVIVHELIHCLMWQGYYYDLRRREVTLFEDFFADELLTCLIEQIVLGKKLDRIDYGEALDYAISETRDRIIKLRKRKKEYRKMINALRGFLRDYLRNVRSKKSDILQERRRLLLELPSPLPSILDQSDT